MHASHGNTQLGDDDFDELLMNHLAARFQEEYGLDPRGERKALARLTRTAEQTKIALSTQPFVRECEEYLMEQEGRARHLREATPAGQAPRFLFRDRDGKYGEAFTRVAAGTSFAVLRTPCRAPKANAIW